MTKTRRRDSNGVRVAAATTGSSMSRDEHLRGAARRDPRQVGVHAVQRRGARAPAGSAAPVGEQLGGERPARGLALARPRRAVEEIGVRGAAAGRQRGAEDGAGVGMALERRAARRSNVGIASARGRDRDAHHHRGDRRRRARRRSRAACTPSCATAASTSSCCASPAASRLSERMRELVKDPALQVDPRAEALLYAAARAQLVDERLRPLLDAGRLGPARPLRRLVAGLPGRRPRPRRRRRSPSSTASRPPAWRPTAPCCCASIPGSARARQGERGEGADRLEQEGDGVLRRPSPPPTTRSPPPSPARFRVLDATQPPEAVLESALAALSDLVPGRRGSDGPGD